MSYRFEGYLYAPRDEEGYMIPRGKTSASYNSHQSSQEKYPPTYFEGYLNVPRDTDGYMMRRRVNRSMTFDIE